MPTFKTAKLYFIALLSIVSVVSTQAQEFKTSKHTIALSVGQSNENILDRIFSPISLQSSLTKFAFAYHQEKRNEFFVDLNSSNLSLEKPNISYNNDLFPSSLIDVNIKVGYLRPIKKKPNLRIGAQLHNSVFVLSFDNYSSGSWLTSEMLEFVGKYQLSLLERHQLSLIAAYPIIGLASRPPYSGLDKFVIDNSDNVAKVVFSKNQLKSGLGYINPQLALHYQYLFGALGFRASLDYQYLHVNSVKSLSQQSIGIYLGLSYTLNQASDEK